MNRPNLHRSAVVAVVALSALLTSGACGATPPPPEQANTPAIVLGPRDVATATTSTIGAGIVLTGSLNPYEQTEVRAQVSGIVARLTVDRGQSVRKGQVIVTIEARGIQSQATSADAQIVGAQAGVALSKRRAESADMLFKRGAISELDYRTAETELEAAEAQLAATRAQAASARENAARTSVEAPISGEVSKRSVSQGEAVQVGQSLLTLVSTDHLELAAQIPVDQASRVRVGQQVEFALDAYPDQTFRGVVARIDPVADPATRQIGVFVRLSNLDHKLVGGLFATGRIATGGQELGVVVPQAAIRGDRDASFVWTVESGVLKRQSVDLGLRDNERGIVLVKSGLAEGAVVVVGPGEMTEGASVKVGG